MIATAETPPLTTPTETRPPPPPPARAAAPAPDRRAADADESLYLIGRPTLRQFLRFVRRQAVKRPPEGELIDEWHAAAAVARTLEEEEAGAADHAVVEKIEVNGATEALLTEFLKDPLVRHGFNSVPTEVAFVNLDQLVVHQHHIDLTYVGVLHRALGPRPDETQIFRAALLHEHPPAPVKWSKTHGNKFVFISSSNDLRFLGPMELAARHLRGCRLPGNLQGIIGLPVGFGSNFLNAIRAEGRLILNNGSHRAYALRALGVTRVPCIVQHVATRAALDVTAASAVTDRPDYYLHHPRPPMLKDYFNPKLRKVLPVHRRLRQITVSYEVEETFIPAP